MDDNKVKFKICNVDWAKYRGPELYDAEIVSDTLIALVELDDPQYAEEVGRKVIHSIGNDHSGTYYPAILGALDIIITLEHNSIKNSARQICARAILNDLYYFEPEVGKYDGCTSIELKEFAEKKLKYYSDEYWNAT